MEPDDLLCSRNARSRTPLVGRAQWKINQPPSLKDNERAWMEHLYRSMRAVERTIRRLVKMGWGMMSRQPVGRIWGNKGSNP